MEPVRTCVGCRQHDNRADLIRVIFAQGNLQIDLGKHLPGRGSWLHPKLECVDAAITRGAFSRSFRAKMDSQTLATLKEQAEKMLDK